MAKGTNLVRKPRSATKAKQEKRDSRRIVVHTPFNYHWSSRAVTHFHTPGEFPVKNEVADFAVQKGYATEVKEEGQGAGTAADTGSATVVGDEDPADADRAADRPPVDDDAG